MLGQYIVTNDIPIISGIEISPKKVLPLELRDDRLCVPLRDFQDQKIKISQEPSENLIGIELELYFDSEPPTDLIEIFYSSDGFKANDSRITSHLTDVTSKKWVTVRFWLPNFRWNHTESDSADIRFDRSLSLSKLYEDSRLTLTEIDGCYLSKFKVIQYRPGSLRQTLENSYLINPSLLENTLLKNLSLPFLLIFSVILIIGFRSRLLIKFLAGLTFPFILLVGFFNHQNIPIFTNIENSEVLRVKEQLRGVFRALQTSRQLADNIFHSKLEKYKDSVNQALERDLKKSKENFPQFEEALRQLAHKIGGELATHGPYKYKFTTNPEMPNIKRRQQFIELMFRPYVNILLNQAKQTSKNRSSALKTGKMRAFNEVQRELEKSFSTDIRIRDFFYRPGKLSESIIVDFDISEMFQLGLKNRVFWSWYIDNNNQNWLYTGYIRRDTLIKHLKDSLSKQLDAQINELNKEYVQANLNCYLSGYEHEPSLKPQELKNTKTLDLVTQLSRNSESEIFLPVIENDELRFYYAKKFGVVEHYIVGLSISGDQFLQRTKERKNKILYVSLLILASVLALSFLMSLSVTQPFDTLVQAMDRIAKGDLGKDLHLPGKNQFSRCAMAFNKMLEELREKEFISKFISRMALTSLVDNSEKTRKESVTIMYCGIKNIDSIMDNLPKEEAIKLLNQCLQIIQNQVVKFGGSVDKFTGNASLCVFKHESSLNQPLEAAIAIRDKMTEWLHQQKHLNRAQLKVTVGIASGKVILGHIGSEKRKDFTCIGNTVNLAARLGNIKLDELVHTQVLIAEQVIVDFPEYTRYSLTKHSNVSIKGKQSKQVFYELD